MLAITLQSWAVVGVAHCKDMQSRAANEVATAQHDHVAMMRKKAETVPAGLHDEHHAMADEGSNAAKSAGVEFGPDDSEPLDCECRCDCSGNCSVTCAASAASLGGNTAHPGLGNNTLHPATLPSQALAAHRLTPLRPPSAAAI